MYHVAKLECYMETSYHHGKDLCILCKPNVRTYILSLISQTTPLLLVNKVLSMVLDCEYVTPSPNS